MASFSLGGLTAPIWGNLAVRFRLHQQLFMGGIIGIAGGAIVFPFTMSLLQRVVRALVCGVGLASASTVANFFIVEVHPKFE